MIQYSLYFFQILHYNDDMKQESFSQSVIDEYLKKMRDAYTHDFLHDYFSNAKEWVDWLVKNKSINQVKYKQLKRLLILEYEKRSKVLQTSTTTIHHFERLPFLFGSLLLFAIFIIILLSMKGSGLFSNQNDSVDTSSDKRVLPFRGMLKNADGSPIDTKQDVYFSMYRSPFDGESLYSGSCVGERGITPEYNGSFTVTLGSGCDMKPIPESIFEDNKVLYLGVRIGNEDEILPRYKISTSGYSQDTALLGGFPAGKMHSSIPYIDEKGAIVIDAESPSIQSTSGIFAIQAHTLSLQTSEDSAGSILFQPSAGGHTIVTSGNFGVGDLSPTSRLSIVGTEPYAAIASLKNLALVDEPETSILDLALATDKNGSNATYVNFYANATRDTIGDRVGSIRLNKDRVVYETSSADFAEYFTVAENRFYEPGFIMSLSKNGMHPSKMNESVVGVVTDSAGYIGNMSNKPNQVLIGLIGQLDVFVSDQHGNILVGDAVGASSIPGYGALNISKYNIVGYALEDMTSDENHFSNRLCPQEFQNQKNNIGNLVRCGKLNILLRPK